MNFVGRAWARQDPFLSFSRTLIRTLIPPPAPSMNSYKREPRGIFTQ